MFHWPVISFLPGKLPQRAVAGHVLPGQLVVECGSSTQTTLQELKWVLCQCWWWACCSLPLCSCFTSGESTQDLEQAGCSTHTHLQRHTSLLPSWDHCLDCCSFITRQRWTMYIWFNTRVKTSPQLCSLILLELVFIMLWMGSQYLKFWQLSARFKYSAASVVHMHGFYCCHGAGILHHMAAWRGTENEYY